MRVRVPLLVLIASALAFIASLYLRWRTPHNAPGDLIGWSAAPSYAAALLAVALAVAATAALIRPSRTSRLPLGGLGVSLAYFAAGTALQLTEFAFPIGVYPGPAGWTGYGHLHWGWSYGVYLGGASGGLAALTALVLRRDELLRRLTTTEAAAALLGLGLLVSFLLPWQKAPGGVTVIGLASPAAMIAAAGLLVGAGWVWRREPRLRLGAAVAVAVLTGAAANGVEFSAPHVYGTWVGIACAVALVALEAARARRPIEVSAATDRWTALRLGSALLLLISLFLPWQQFAGGRFTSDGWQAIPGATAGGLALLILAAPVFVPAATYALEAVLGIAVLIATVGIVVTEEDNRFVHVGYGAYVGYAAAGLLLLATFARLEWPHFDRRRALPRTLPVLASLACVGAAVVPGWVGVLPLTWELRAEAVRSWFSVAALFLALHLLHLWVAQIRRARTPGLGLVLTPLLILPLPALELVRERSVGIVWGGVTLIGLCLLLAALGWIERSRGVENLRLPEILRLDRLPETES